MIISIALILFLVFLFLASIHVYWAFGGHWGGNAVIPTKEDNAKMFTPTPLPTLIVALGLLLMGLIILASTRVVPFNLPAWIDHYGIWFIAAIFFLRAIGDFRYVGFFKKITKTRFARHDTRYYSPLCLVICILAIILAFYK